ncbi:MAG: putative capsular polysaccharide synthesis family protein [Vulcanimicrobiaceae bacterium]
MPFYLIHQAGKVASQTLSWTITMADRSARVERHHYLEASNLDEVDRLCDVAKLSSQVQSLRKQTNEARAAMLALANQEPTNVWVLTGFRDPLDLAISAFFQNLSYYSRDYVSPEPGESYDQQRFDAQVDRVIESFRSHFDEHLNRVRTGTDVANVRELDLRRKLQDIGVWFEREFKTVHGIDVYGLDIGSRSFIHFEERGVNFVLYRMETFAARAGDVIAELPIPKGSPVVSDNVSAAKDYAILYQRFRERFAPTDEMVEYYYESPFYRHFYRESQPLYRIGASAAS